tara:strand:- start:30104 stop:30295 length:192 start_codon:yes stop_codon:yes gene_type:complete
MDGKSLRTKGPIGNDYGVNEGEDARNSKLTDAIASPHPDNLAPENRIEQETMAKAPKDNLGHR